MAGHYYTRGCIVAPEIYIVYLSEWCKRCLVAISEAAFNLLDNSLHKNKNLSFVVHDTLHNRATFLSHQTFEMSTNEASPLPPPNTHTHTELHPTQ